MKYLLVITTIICLSGCSSTGKSRSQTIVSPPAPQQVKSDRDPTPAYRLSPPNLGSVFSLRSFFDWPDGKPVQIDIESRLAADSEMRVYRVLTPVAFLSHLASLDPIAFSAPVIEKLALAQGQSRDYWQPPPTDLPEVAKFELVYRQPFQCHFNQEEYWQRQTITLGKEFEQGIYLLETRIGPQVAYLPFVVSSLALLGFTGDQQSIAWIVDIASGKIMPNFPIFCQQQQYNWQQKITNADGLLTLTRPRNSSWLLPWNRQRIHCCPLFSSPAPAASTSARNSKQATPAATAKPAMEYIQLPQERQVFAPGNSLAIEICSASPEPQARVELQHRRKDRQWQTIARQRKTYHHGRARLYFQLDRPGWYRLQSATAAAEIYVTGANQLERIMPLQRYYHYQQPTLPVLVPGKKVEQLLVARDGQRLLSWRQIEPFSGERVFELSAGQIYQELQISVFYWQKQRMFEQTWRFPALIADGIIQPTPLLAKTALSLPVPVTPKHDTKSRVWKQNGLPPPPLFSAREVPQLPTRAAGSTQPTLYQEWGRQELLKNYSRALKYYQNERYDLTTRYATAALQLAPEHHGATRLLAAAASKSNPQLWQQRQFQVDLIGRLQTTVIHALPQTLSLWDFVQRLSDASGVCLELDPDVVASNATARQKITGLPSGEPALSLLEYVLKKRGLTWKLEHGVVIIVSRHRDLSRELLTDLDQRLNRQLQRLNQTAANSDDASHLQREYLWQGESAGRQCVPVSFPSPGIWTLWIECRDQQQHLSRQFAPILVLPPR